MKKLLALVLAMLMLVCCFTACNTTPEDPVDPVDPADPADPADPEDPEDPADPEDPEDPADPDDTDANLPVVPTERPALTISDSFYPTNIYASYDYKDMRAKLRAWFYEKLEANELFSVSVGGEEFKKMLEVCEVEIQTGFDEGGDEHIVATYSHGRSGLTFTVDAVLFSDTPTLDYVVTVKNVSEKVSPKVNKFYPLDSDFTLKGDELELVTGKGSTALVTDFMPEHYILGTDKLNFYPMRGRSSDGAWPYFDVIGEDCGVIFAIGWSGTWEADFAMTEESGKFEVLARQQNFDAVILPGEEFRTPRIVINYYDGDTQYGHNIWRETVLEHYTPDDGSEDRFVPPLYLNFWGGINGSFFITTMEMCIENDLDFDMVWLDAGWYADYDKPTKENGQTANKDWSKTLGWWEINPKCFENGSFKSCTDAAEKADIKFMLWYMIESGRVAYRDKMTLGEESYYHTIEGNVAGGELTLMLAEDEVLERLLDYYRYMFDVEGVDCIRLDNGVGNYIKCWEEHDKLLSSKINDGENLSLRNGIAENKHIVNLYKLWETLYEEYYGNFYLDNCASGGRRLDIEMTRLGIPLWRTDYYPTDREFGEQAHTQWLAQWLPLNSIAIVDASDNMYDARTLYSASAAFTPYDHSPTAIKNLKMKLEEFQRVRPYWLGSYYQLLDITYEQDDWQAYQLYRNDLQKGMFVTIRRHLNENNSQQIKLQGLDPDAKYLIHNLDDPEGTSDIVMLGKQLMRSGLTIIQGARSILVHEISLVQE